MIKCPICGADMKHNHIHGIEHLARDVRKHAVVGSCVAFVGESAMSVVLEEEHLVLSADDIEETIRDEITI